MARADRSCARLAAGQGEPFEKIMAAIASNAREQQGNGQVILVLERPRAAEVS